MLTNCQSTAVLEAIERKTETLEAVERTADAMCGRAFRAEKRIGDQEARIKALEAMDPAMTPALADAPIQVADMTANMLKDL